MGKNFENFLQLKLLSSIEGIGLKTISILLSEFEDANSIINASKDRLLSITELPTNAAKKILHFDFSNTKLISFFSDIYNQSLGLGIKIITYYCPEYPKNLKNIYAPPSVLYTLGNGSLSNRNMISIVGTRNNSAYGKIQTEELTRELAQNGITIVSGMAKGIDTIAHKTALENYTQTIAVIGSGLDIIYPAENKILFNQIQENGLIISEFELGTKPDAGNFPRRNRIISALSLGTLVVETKKKGGALQTANLALEQGKEVFALPGNVSSPNSEGTNMLIQNGSAKLITTANDILVELDLSDLKINKKIPEAPISLSFFEEKIFENLSFEPTHIDKIAYLTKLSIQDCLTNLLIMEMKGIVQQLPGKTFSKS